MNSVYCDKEFMFVKNNDIVIKYSTNDFFMLDLTADNPK